MSKPIYSDAEWRRLVQAQKALQEEEEVALAKLLRLKKQMRLLKSRAHDFIARGYQEIAELEELDRLDEERVAAVAAKQKDREAKACPSRGGAS
ncbi:hypothetical protein N7523_005699 [Penicillium sp. IBT 18751x]|nr:hypothetical protein N7523_005699 [Penicillium sp. IBT 18751x]